MKLKMLSTLAAGLLCAGPTMAATVTIDFEGVNSFGSIHQFYNGGTDVPGDSTHAPASGVNYGISFGLDALAFQNDEITTNLSNIPSGVSVMAPVGPSAALNVAAGFAGQASFFYSSTEATTVSIYSGLDGTGSVLGMFNLVANASDGCSDAPYCHWDQATVHFSGVAQSIQFGTAASVAGFDNVTLAPVPLPAAAWLMLSAMGGLGTMFRRKRTA